MSKLSHAIAVVRTRLLWGWRFAQLGPRSTLGRCRLVTVPRSVAIGHHVSVMGGWVFADLNKTPGSEPRITIGDGCTILFDCQINARERVTIGDYCLFASRVFISDADHVLRPGEVRTSQSKEYTSKPVVIEHDCWLGQNAVILKGVTVGHHSIVAANAVVNRDVPPYSIVGGVPAKVIGRVPSDADSTTTMRLMEKASI